LDEGWSVKVFAASYIGLSKKDMSRRLPVLAARDLQ
jgi:hypothetical protein